MEKKITFGTDGWRGIIADDFTGANLRLVAQATANHFLTAGAPSHRTVIVGYDTRAQGEYFAVEAAKIMAANGLKPILSAQPCSSPAVSYLVAKLNACGGVMITASHNPPSFNGFKIKAYYGGSASPQIITKIEAELQTLVDAGTVVPTPSLTRYDLAVEDFRPAYLGHLTTLVDLELIKSAGFKILIDPMHGSGAGYISSILRDAGLDDVIEIRGERNPYFGGVNPEPVAQNMGATFDAVKRYEADIALVTDGDADRVGAADSRGNFIDCHRIFSVLLKHLAEYRQWTGDVVKTVSTTQLINKISAKYGRKVYETPIGFKYICDLMLEEDIMIGGEESGGIGIKNHIPERDGVLMSLLMLEAMAVRGKKFEYLIDEIMLEYGDHEYFRVDLHPDASKMPDITARLKEFDAGSFAGHSIKEISKKDGTKLIFEDDSWLLLRPSGTEPVVRVYSEASTSHQVAELIEAGTKTVNQ
jgi:alpha-D-glucose phosphate-specific phosphoglucomutase